MGRPRKFDSNQVLDIALKRFWTEGYTAVRLDDICHEAGITKPSLYNAFGDKNALYEATLKHYEALFQARVMAALASATNAEDAIKQYFDTTVSILTDPDLPKGCLRVKTLAECATTHPKLVEVACQQRDRSLKAVAAMLIEYGQSSEKANELAELIVVLSDGLAASARTDQSFQSLHRTVNLAYEAVKALL
ncbi:MAG: TetR/AcrR family transcriptional regulator [Cyanobacteria bacterium P01_G01_bin.38]